ncbi:hypothetical protein HN371_10520 [Candidatus Poribacteria bacterium]|jgi:hypothetical protein|nr:hypothetical protein [Candidatus Poribacteria bacterium]MBT5531429.1 hypothetical protein [Candidatus Poribacteria bacterium]MBT7101631.1 hypothetical protein [Candidatus Poribacteria bacterium]
MAKRIRAIRQTTETYYADDGSVAREVHRVAYLKEDADDPDLSAWADVDAHVLDETATLATLRDDIRAAANRREGIA